MLKVVAKYCAHKLGFLELRFLHDQIFQHLFRYTSEKYIQKNVKLFLEESFENLWNPQVLKCLREAQENGDFTVILSSSVDFLVQAIAEKLQVDRWEATQYDTDPLKGFTRIKKILCGEEKALYLLQLMQDLEIDKHSTIAYSDSHLDIPFLTVAGNPIAVNPDRKLKKICHERNWDILITD